MTDSFAPIHIVEITLRLIPMELVESFDTASSETSIRAILLVEIADIDGRHAWGECVAFETPDYMSETINMAEMALQKWIAPLVLGQSFYDPAAVSKTLDQHIDGCEMAKAALEMACWDLSAQIQGVPLATLLGGTRETVETGIAIGLQNSDEVLAEKVQGALDEGYQRIKLKVQPGRDVEMLKPLVERIGMDTPLMVDANGSYSGHSWDALVEMDSLNLIMIEQPFRPKDVESLTRVNEVLNTSICLDESITSLGSVESMRKLHTGSIVNLKPGRVGGLTNSLAIHDYCGQHSIPLWCGGMLESGIGRAFNVALASLPGFTIPGDLSPSKRYWAKDLVWPEWEMDSSGQVAVPLENAGTGVEIDTERIEAMTLRKSTLNLTR